MVPFHQHREQALSCSKHGGRVGGLRKGNGINRVTTQQKGGKGDPNTQDRGPEAEP